MDVFDKQLALAVELDRPVFLHQRLGFAEFNAIVERHVSRSDAARICVHCFTGDAKELEYYVARGYFVGITGFVCDQKRAVDLRAALERKLLPLEQLLIETDGPFMAPKNIPRVPYRCEPAMLPYVAKELADLMGIPFDVLCKATTENAARFFRLLKK